MQLVKAKEAAQQTGLSEWALKRGAKEGLYPHTMVGNRFYFDLGVLEQTIREDMTKRMCASKQR